MSVRVLHSSAFAGVEELLAAAEEGVPTLFAVEPDQLEQILPQLAPHQDVVVSSLGPELIAFRGLRLGESERLGDDRLTGLLARQPFMSHLQQWPPQGVTRPVRSLIILDLDRFKGVNDELGHAVGDAVLVELGSRVRGALPEGALAARLGGEEVAVLLREGREAAMAFAGKLHALVRDAPFTEHELRVTVSVAVATGGESVDSPALIGLAESALYAAKAGGRDRVVHFSDVQRDALEKNIDPAIQGFENMTRVIADRVADLLSRRSRELFEELRDEADMDALTGLYTRRYLERRLGFEVGSRASAPLSVALADVDEFGLINKESGWPSGDRILAGVAARIVGGVREGDWVARYGGDEFLVVLPGTELAEASAVLERVRRDVEERPLETTRSRSRQITLSVGVVELRVGESIADLTERASQKLLEAKGGGRNRVID